MMDRVERCIKLAQEEHYCPYCKQRLSCCEAPPMHVGDGLGWGSDIIFICLNDECSLYANSWDQFEAQYGHHASCRYILTPGSPKGEPMMVGSSQAYTGSIIDVEALKKQNKRFAMEKKAIAKLDTCVEEKNLEPVMFLILDEAADLAMRNQAVELLVELNDLACIDPIRDHKFRHTEIGQKANIAITEVLKACHRKECPHCMEIIKSQAKVCKHCGKDV